MSDERLIETEDALARAIAKLSPLQTLSVDTEFLWERTYHPKLALVQVAGRDETGEIHGYAVDPLVLDPAPLLRMLAEPSRLKIMHAGRLDQQIMNMLLGAPLVPVFDTQRAASLAGFGSQIGYANLVEALFGRRLKKTEQYTDWTKRPLRQAQIDYALLDVIPLVDVYETLRDKLAESGRTKWAEEEMASLMDPATYAEDRPEDLFLKVKSRRKLDRQGLAILRELAVWRDGEARKRDRRPGFVIKDQGLVEIASRRPKKPAELHDLRGLHRKEANRSANGILAAIRRGEACPEDDLPQIKRGTRKAKNVDAIVDLMRAFLAKRAKEAEVASETLATTSELERLARDGFRERYKRDHPVLDGWRGEVIGSDLLKLLRGELTLGVDPDSADVKLVDSGKQPRVQD